MQYVTLTFKVSSQGLSGIALESHYLANCWYANQQNQPCRTKCDLDFQGQMSD